MSMTTTSSDEVSVVPAARSVPLVAGDTPAMREWAEQLVAGARAEGVELTGDDGLLTAMIRRVLQTGLDVELSDHLGYEPHDPAGRGSGNSRNGTSRKTVTTDVGDVELAVPRDRNGRSGIGTSGRTRPPTRPSSGALRVGGPRPATR